MYKIYQLEKTEVNIVDKLIEIYQLPLEFILGPDEGVEWDSDYLYNTDTDENLCLENGLDYILEAINSDDRELFQIKLEDWEQIKFLSLATELGLTTEINWKERDLREDIPSWQKRMVLPLEGVGRNGETYKIVATKEHTMPNHNEIDVVVEDQYGAVVQDIVRIEQAIKDTSPSDTKHVIKTITVKVYKDEYNEDYTDIFHINVYDDGEITTNMNY